MKHHPYCDLFPSMDDAALADMAADIAAHGLRVKIVTHGGVILDGKNRFAACKRVKVKPEFADYDGPADDASLMAYVASMNLPRRHLSVVQRAFIAAEMAKLKHGHRPHASRDACGDKPPVTQQQAADAMEVSRPTVQRARTVLDKGTTEEIKATKSGEVALSRAAKAIQEKEAEVRAAAKADPNRFGPFVARLDAGDKPALVHKDFVKERKRTTHKREPLRDARNAEVPDALRDLFGNPWYEQFAEDVAEILDRVGKFKRDVKAQGRLLREWLPVEKCDEFAGLAIANLKYLASQVASNRPHAICPDCEGAGCKGDGSACHKAGWVPKYRADELKAEGRL